MRRLIVDARAPDRSSLDEAAVVIQAGGVVAIPTDTLYGLAADPFSRRALARVFAVKGRDATEALPLIAADTGQVADWLGRLPEIGSRLASRFWPGPLTLVMARPSTLPAEAAGGRDSVGVRVPAHAVARRLCEICGRPLTATSANWSGQEPASEPDQVEAALGSRLDLLLDAGPAPGGAPSTIVDVRGAEPRLIRAGAISWEEVRSCVG
jgi:L-threonylcarbamoyladenylate synthase